MSNMEIRLALKAAQEFVSQVETEEPKKNRCRSFFDIIHHIRVFLQITTELLKRIEQLEEEVNNLKIN